MGWCGTGVHDSCDASAQRPAQQAVPLQLPQLTQRNRPAVVLLIDASAHFLRPRRLTCWVPRPACRLMVWRRVVCRRVVCRRVRPPQWGPWRRVVLVVLLLLRPHAMWGPACRASPAVLPAAWPAATDRPMGVPGACSVPAVLGLRMGDAAEELLLGWQGACCLRRGLCWGCCSCCCRCRRGAGSSSW